jgi:hypothetical protein
MTIICVDLDMKRNEKYFRTEPNFIKPVSKTTVAILSNM